MPRVADRVAETTTTVGTGTLILNGALPNYQRFVDGIGIGEECYYCIVHQTAAQWEVGIGTVGDGTLVRDTVLASSSGVSAVSFSAGTKHAFVTFPAAALVSRVPDVYEEGRLVGYVDADGSIGQLPARFVPGRAQPTLLVGPHTAEPVTINGIVVTSDDYTNGGAQFTGFGAVLGASGGVRYNNWAFRGTIDAPTAIMANDRMFRFTGFGHDGTSWNTESQPRVMMRFSAAEDWTPSAQGTYIDFFVTEAGTVTARQPLRLGGLGSIFIGTRQVFTPNIAYETPFAADASMVHFLGQGSGVGQGATIRHVVAGAIPAFAMSRSNGTFAAPTALAANDVFASYVWGGHDGTGWTASRVQLRGIAVENWVPGAHGSKLQFRVTPTGTATVATIMEVLGAGVAIFDTNEPATPSDGFVLWSDSDVPYVKAVDGNNYPLINPHITVGTVEPTSPNVGDIWVDTN